MDQLRKAFSLAIVLDGITLSVLSSRSLPTIRAEAGRDPRASATAEEASYPLKKGDKPAPGSNIYDSVFGNLFFSSLIHIAFSLVIICSLPRKIFGCAVG
jgi:hypothetical protein